MPITLAHRDASDRDPARYIGALTAGTAASLWSNAWRQFRRNKLAMVGMAYLIFLAFVAIFAPVILAAQSGPERSRGRPAIPPGGLDPDRRSQDDR